MKVIRYGIFETNSSSTHAIVVPKKIKKENYSLYDSLDHNFSFGRGECRLVDSWDEKLAYIYIVIKDNFQPHISEFKAQVIKIYEEIKKSQDTSYSSYIKPQDIFRYIDDDKNDGNITGNDNFVVLCERWGNYVDHSSSIDEEFITRIFEDYEFLKRFLFNKESYITIGGDEYRGYNIKTIGFEYDYDEDYECMENCSEYEIKGEFWNKLEEYKKENDVYLKGN